MQFSFRDLLVLGLMSPALAAVLPRSGTLTMDPNLISKKVQDKNPDLYNTFMQSGVVMPRGTFDRRSLVARNESHIIPDYIYVVMCDDPGFRGDCLVFGSKPGACSSFFLYNQPNTTAISDTYNHKVSSLSTNTGGNCQFYHEDGCDENFDDPGVTLNYNFDLYVNANGYSGDYDKSITSWRC